MKVYRDRIENGNVISDGWFDIMECTYTGTDMGERKVVAEIKWATPIDFQMGDYIELQMQTLQTGVGLEGSVGTERFYIYTQPTIKKNARAMSSGEAFVHTVTFYPRQYELACVQMRDFVQQNANADTIIYTGFDSVNFYGGAHELMERIMACLAEAYNDGNGNPLWSYDLAPSVNEDLNTSLERFPFSFSGNSVMDALVKLSDKQGINTTFFINGRKIYVGYRRPYFCRVTAGMSIDTDPQSQIFNFQYGKTSDKDVAINYGGLYNITRAIGNTSPITKLYAYGASRNLNRYYCSDRIRSGRYVNKLMLPSFDDDGRTDFVISEDGVAKYGIREASKQFEEIYPSLRYMTYGDLRQVKYCIKVKASGLSGDSSDLSGHNIADSTYPIVRIQCYRVVESETTGVNKLVESAPPEDLAVMIHATGKVIKTILYGDDGQTPTDPSIPRSVERQLAHDSRVPTTDGDDNYVVGSCFAVHDPGFDGGGTGRADWFISPHVWKDYSASRQEAINLHQISYADTFWLTDLYVFESYNQTHFKRDGYSAWAYPRLNARYSGAVDGTLVNEVVAVEPIVIEDTSWNISEKTNQQYFDIYLRDVGFKIDEQNDFGEMVFIVDGTLKVSVLDGLLTGREFEVSGKVTDSQFSCVCAYNEDGTENDEFFNLPDSPRTATGSQYARAAHAAGAIWRIRLLRLNNDDQNYANLDIILPMKGLEMKAGDHVVFLDIFMPDIYIHAAENRLLREALKYLDANDKSTVQYSVDFDKVRMGQQIPNYALQMREGLNIRLKDADLDIVTQNGIKELANYEPNGQFSSVDMYSIDDAAYEDHNYNLTIPISRVDGRAATGIHEYIICPEEDIMYDRILNLVQPVVCDQEIHTGNIHSIYLRIYKLRTPSEFYSYNITNTVKKFSLEKEEGGLYYYKVSFRWSEKATLYQIFHGDESRKLFTGLVDGQSKKVAIAVLDIYYRTYDSSTPRTLNVGEQFYCKTLDTIDFRRNKYYDVIIDILNPDLAYQDTEQSKRQFTLAAVPASEGYNYTPDYAVEDISEQDAEYPRLKYSFYLDESFNEEYAYKPSILYIQDGNTESAAIRLVKIVEKDYESGSQIIDYVDLKVDNVNIKIHDNTRSEDSRISPITTPPIYEIQANFREASQASAWVTLSQQVADNANESAYIAQTQEALANMARRHYQELLRLRGSIFDPDGTCDQVFLQVMMMQVGADSMNFQLDKTKTVIAGNTIQMNNCSINTESSTNVFAISADDVLRHYVYTQGAQGGTWNIAGNRTFNLSPITVEGQTQYPVYYVCLKCAVNGTSGEWVVETTQHPVNDANHPNYWFFNWGILSHNGVNYELTETRGNAYMYGDNLVCGKISSMAKNSYFDLNNGDFVLGAGSGNPALSYVNGRLTISGVTAEIEQALTSLQLLDGNVTSLENQVNSISVGGRNLLRDTAFVKKGANLVGWSFSGSGGTRQTNADDDNTEMGLVKIVLNDNSRVQLSQTAATGYNTIGDSYVFSAKMKTTDAEKTIVFRAGYGANTTTAVIGTSWTDVKINCKVTGTGSSQTYSIFYLYIQGEVGGTLYIKEAMLEKGTLASSWREAPEDTAAEIQENKDYVDTIKTALQNQIDGVVDSYFMEGIPTMDDTRKPLSNWKAEGGGTIDYAKHEGDTYTDILPAKVSLSDVRNNLPVWIEQGILRVGSTHYGKTYEQQLTANNNYCRTKGIFALKSGITLGATPSGIQMLVCLYDSDKLYRSGLAWRTASISLDTYASTYKYFSILFKSTTDDTPIAPSSLIGMTSGGDIDYPYAGHSWRFCNNEDSDDSTWHWHEIADSDAVLALQKAAEAQDTADGKRRVFTTQPIPPYDAGDLWANAYYPYSTENSQNLYNNVLLKCKTSRVSGSFSINDWEDSSRAISAANNAQAAANDALDKAANIVNDGIISGGTEKATLKKEWQEIAGDNMLGNTNGSYKKATSQASEYGLSSSSEVTALNTAYANLEYAMKVIVGYSNNAWTNANMGNDTYIGAEDDGSDRYDIVYPSGWAYSGTDVDRNVFAKLWRVYYDAEIALLNSISNTIDNREIGGENLIGEENPIVVGDDSTTTFKFRSILGGKNVPDSETTNPKCVNSDYLENGKKYVFSVDSVVQSGGAQTQFTLQVVAVSIDNNGSVSSASSQHIAVPISSSRVIVTFTVPDDGYNYRVRITNGIYGSSSAFGKLTFYNLMLQVGDKATAYQLYYKYLSEALENSTDVMGGIVATTQIQLRYWDGKYVDPTTGTVYDNNATGREKHYIYNAGMSGLKDDNVLIWGDANYQEALYASTDPDYKKSSAGNAEVITTLIKKDGTGKIGVFRIGEDKVLIKTSNGNVIIDDDEGISIVDSNNILRSLITPKPLSSVSIQNSEETAISYSSHEKAIDYVTNNSYATVRSGIVVTNEVQFKFDTYIFIGKDGQFSQSGNFPTSVKFVLYAYNSSTNTRTKLAESSNVGVSTMDRDSSEGLFMNTQHLTVDKTISSAGTYAIQLQAVFTDSQGRDINNMLYDAQNKIRLSDRYVIHQYANVYSYGSNISNNSVMLKHAGTIVASDGFASYFDKDTFFKVVNTANGQQIYAKGLVSSGTIGSGQLVKKNSALSTFAYNLGLFLNQYIKDSAKEDGFVNALNILEDSIPDDAFITAV